MTRPAGRRPVRTPGQAGPPGPGGGGDPGVAGNERLTALAGLVILLLIGAEVATLPNIGALLAVHILVGVTLAGPLAVKTASTGWRFIRYYTGHPAYRRKAPPRPLLRALAPLLLLTTIVVIGSGIALSTTRPGDPGVDSIGHVHVIGFVIWGVLVAIHLFAYIRRLPGLIAGDWRPDGGQQARGRGHRLAVNLIALVLGAIAALLILPAFSAWMHG